MFNTVAKVAGIAVVGGVTLFTTYSYTRGASQDSPPAEVSETPRRGLRGMPVIADPAALEPATSQSDGNSASSGTAAPTMDGALTTTTGMNMAIPPEGQRKPGYFIANKRLIDKPDDGRFFTEKTRSAAFDPCLKSDGTPYYGPGTVVDPFAGVSPCLPRATAQSFDVAGTPTLPRKTDSDGQTPFGPPKQPDWNPEFPGPPDDEDDGSDYRTL
ncbi:hypothetical protein [Parvularcula sp. LCG005]|uniref:hypothetical protein n=1 Tax=Parvularcula sp. LCG005 TaxID=3078805 RepID=UPI002942528E|nr:hypothetical protein [Parvularcula sp. LCG005]WOI54104.1 hypothetical protein RUI03_03665 [Parvularcula sp. LCG005]